MALSAEDRRRIDDCLPRIYALQDLDEFSVCLMRELPKLVASELAGFNEVNYRARRMITVLDSAEAQLLYQEIRPDFERIMHQNPLIAHYHENIGDAPRKISDFLPVSKWRRTPLYQKYYSKVDATYQIAVSLVMQGPTIVAVAFNRMAKDFSERDRAVLSALQPHLVRAYLNAQAYSKTLSRLETREHALANLGLGTIDLDASFRIAGASELALDCLRRFFPHHYLEDGRLPTPVEEWCLEVVAADTEAAAPAFAGAPFHFATAAGRLTLRAMLSSRTGPPSLLVEQHIDRRSFANQPSLGLTARQGEVLFWICQGKSNAEIAIILGLSIRTVHKHVQAILKTLAVDNRTAAALKGMSAINSDRRDISTSRPR